MECLAWQRGMSIIFFFFRYQKEIYYNTALFSRVCYIYSSLCVWVVLLLLLDVRHRQRHLATSPQCCCPMAVVVVVTYHVHVAGWMNWRRQISSAHARACGTSLFFSPPRFVQGISYRLGGGGVESWRWRQDRRRKLFVFSKVERDKQIGPLHCVKMESRNVFRNV
jgi:hypothetical protein